MEQRGRAKILLGIPPLGRARCGAAGAEDALMWLAFDLGISFLSCCGRSLRFNDGSTLLYSGDLLERRDHGCSPRLRLDLGEAGEPVVALDVHGASTPSRQLMWKGSDIFSSLELDERVEHHGAADRDVRPRGVGAPSVDRGGLFFRNDGEGLGVGELG